MVSRSVSAGGGATAGAVSDATGALASVPVTLTKITCKQGCDSSDFTMCKKAGDCGGGGMCTNSLIEGALSCN
jgi:hypothetical protein